jgi:hypothetical protein
MLIPYGGRTEGFLPGRMGGGSPLSFRARPTATMGAGRTPFSLSPVSGGMPSASRGMVRGLGPRNREAMPLGLRGGMGRQGSDSLGVMPPRISYPFRQPPSPGFPSSSSMGSSM